MITVACVYKSGGDYTPDYVRALKAGIDLNKTPFNRFVCLTDRPDKIQNICEVIPLKHDLKGWWSKIELFEPNKFFENEVVVYFDLDTLILKDIHHLVSAARKHKGPKMLRGRSVTAVANNYPASGIMSWRGNEMSVVYNQFFKIGVKRAIVMQEQDPRKDGQQGDQGFIRKYVNPIRWQDVLPENYFWYKADYIRKGRTINPDSHILVWSGRPRLSRAFMNVQQIWRNYVQAFQEIR